MSVQQKKEALTNHLRVVSQDDKLFIHDAPRRMGHKFAVAKVSEYGGIDTISNYMTYDEMNAYFSGILCERMKKIHF